VSASFPQWSFFRAPIQKGSSLDAAFLFDSGSSSHAAWLGVLVTEADEIFEVFLCSLAQQT
jgi:hypothetical protein